MEAPSKLPIHRNLKKKQNWADAFLEIADQLLKTQKHLVNDISLNGSHYWAF